jgi:glycosyltransferase involved in cell wall biosynthesis
LSVHKMAFRRETKQTAGVKVLQIIDGVGGGAETYVIRLTQYLKKAEVKVLVVFMVDGPSIVKAKRLGLHSLLVPHRCFPDLCFIRKLRGLIAKEKVDIIHTHTIRTNFYGRILRLISGKPLHCITTVHSFLEEELSCWHMSGQKKALLRTRERLTWPLVDQFITVCPGLEDKLICKGIHPKKVLTIRHGIETPGLTNTLISSRDVRGEYGIAQNETVIGIVGRLEPVKNHELFLTAAKEVLRNGRPVKFLVVGDGSLMPVLQNKAQALGIANAVIFTGWRDDIDACMNSLDILVLCSSTESQGLVVLEAMSFGKPVVAPDVNEIGETVINGRTGLLVSPNDKNALAEAITTLQNNEKLQRKLGAQGRRLVKREYTLERMGRETLQVYQNVLDSGCRESGKTGRLQRLFGSRFS